MKNIIRKSLGTCIIFIVITGCADDVSKVSRPLLGTVVTVTVAGGPAESSTAIEAAFREVEGVQKRFSPYDPESEISTVNKNASLRPCSVSNEFFSLVKTSLEVSGITGGAFDITFASAGGIWDFSREDFSPPDDKVVRALLPFISFKNIRLDDRAKTIRFLKSGTKIGLGGIAKGYATGRAISAIKGRNIRGAIVSCAGDIQVTGSNYGKPWRLGIKDPRGAGIFGTIDMRDGEAVSTSGDYERFRIVNGRRYHHIMDPATGYPADSGLISVSVFSDDPVKSDAYSTALFVSGLDKSKKILASVKGLSAVFVTGDMKVYATGGLKGRISFREGLDVAYF